MYANKLKENLIKNDFKLKDKKFNYNPYEKASIFSKLFFLWLNPLLNKGSKKIIDDNDVFDLREKDKVEIFVKPIEKEFKKNKKRILKNKKKENNLIVKIIMKYHKKQIIFFCIWGLIKALSNIFSANLWGYFISAFKDDNTEVKNLIIYSIVFILLKILEIFLNAHLNYNFSSLGFKVKFALNYIIFKKILRIKQFNNNFYSFGDLINVNNVETNKFIEFFNYIPNIVTAPITLILGLYLLINLMGWSAVIAISTFILFVLLNIKLSKLFIKYELELIKKRGNRLKFINEIISGWRFIKFSVMENFFFKKLIKIKETELLSLKKQFKRTIFTLSLSWFIPLSFLTILIISEYLIKKTLDVTKILKAVIYFSIIDETIKFLPNVIIYFANSLISGKRINKFLFQEEINFKNIKYIKQPDEENNVINIKNMDFYWKKNKEQINKKKDLINSFKNNSKFSEKLKEFELTNINLKIRNKSLVAIIGQIGSGKTSLMNSLFGELDLKNNKQYEILDSIAVVSQKPWIRNKTLKENILNGKIYNEELYKESIKYSCLLDDLKQLDEGDETLIGDKGINLSGGQKVRISIARALYSEKNLLIMDDPLSALDINVSEYVFKKGIKEYLKGKTRIIITHNIYFLKYFDRILLLDNGKIVEDGSYDIIKNTDNYKNLINILNEKNNIKNEEKKNSEDLNTLSLEKVKSKNFDLKIINEKQIEDKDPMITRLMNTENKSKGRINLKIIYNYIKFSESKISFLGVIIILILWGICYIYSYFFLNYSNKFSKTEFLVYYSLINFAQVVLVYLRLKIVFTLSIKISRKLNKLMIFRIIHCSLLKFLDKIPIGTILNRFSDDTEQIDRYLMMVFSFTIFWIKRVIVSIVICCIFASPFILIFFLLFIFIANYYRKFYMKTFREISRLKSVSNSPLNQIINETILGTFVIRAYNLNDNLINDHNNCMNNNLKYRLIQNGMKSWFLLRITIMNLVIIIPCFIFVILFRNNDNKELVGIMFTFLLTFINLSSYLMNVISFFEEKMIAFERCIFLTQIKPEKNYKINEKELISDLNKKNYVEFKNGIITIENLKIKYSLNLPYVIKGISCQLKNKVGIIGRTGAGKSTLIQSFYGLFDDYEGNIKIDGIDIKNIDIQNLRYSFSIISQDPIIFEDSVRNNLDPLKLNSDEFINEIINELNLTEKVIDLGGLEGKIDSQGKNLSNGEKQLFCLIRIILNKKKIILLDEATSNIDSKTEETIQKIMNKYFKDCTQLIIAHRLNTILHCDKILVLENGSILEYDSPKILLQKEDSYFSNIMKNNENLKEYLK